MADLNVAVKIGAENLASGPLQQVAKDMASVEEQSRLAGGAAGGFTVQVLRASDASTGAAKAHQEEAFSLGELGKSFAETTETALSFGLGMAAMNAASEVIERLKASLIDLPEQFENARISFETFTGSADVAAKLLEQVQIFSTRAPFSFTALADTAKTLVALGTAADEVPSRMQDIATAVAAIGGTDADLQRVATSLGRISETGVVDSRVMRQLVSENIPAWQILETGLGKTQAQLQEMLKTGQITTDVFDRAFHTWATSGDVADVLGKRADTASGSMAVLGNAISHATVTALEPFTASINRSAADTAKFAQSGQLEQWGRNTAAALRTVGDALNSIAPSDKTKALYEATVGEKSALDYTGMAAEKTAADFDKLTKSSDDAMHSTVALNSAMGDAYVNLTSAGQAAANYSEQLRQAREDAAALAKSTAENTSQNDLLRQSIGALPGSSFGPVAEAAQRLEDGAAKAAKAVGSIGQRAEASIPGLQALDNAMFGTSQALAGVQLSIEERNLARLSRRPLTNDYQREAYLQELLKVEGLQRQVEFGSALRGNSGTTTGSSFRTGFGSGANGVNVNVNVGNVLTSDHAAAAGAQVTSVLNGLIASGSSATGRANRQLAGAR